MIYLNRPTYFSKDCKTGCEDYLHVIKENMPNRISAHGLIKKKPKTNRTGPICANGKTVILKGFGALRKALVSPPSLQNPRSGA